LAARGSTKDHLAVEYAERYLANNPWSASVHNDLAGLLAERGDFRLAIVQAEQAKTLNPSDLQIYGRLLSLYQQTGDFDKVRKLVLTIEQLGGEIREAQPPPR